jgi:hypothetical protein
MQSIRCLMAMACCAVSVLPAGCSSIPGLSALTRKYPIADARHPVAEVVCIWQPGEGHSPQGLPCRGFAGQFMFVSAGSPIPAQVKGSVTIYVFDDVGTLEEQAQPSEVYEFNSEQWASFARETKLGMTYQLFVPYTRKGMQQAECDLRIRFTPDDGGMPVYSPMSSITLKGKTAAGVSMQPLGATLERQGPGGLDVMSDPTAREFARKLQEESPNSQPVPTEPPTLTTPITSFRQSVTPEQRLQRLEGLLDQSITGKTIQQADYETRASR